MVARIVTRAKSYAIGLGEICKNGGIFIGTSFQHTDENDKNFRDVLQILHEACLYDGGNENIQISKEQAKKLLPKFKGHQKMTKFLKSIQRLGGVIIITHRKRIPQSYEQALLLADILRPKKQTKAKKIEKSDKKKTKK
jgi:uncharacterized protein (UPF0128 family)